MSTDLAVKLAEVESQGKTNAQQIEYLKVRQDNMDKLVTSVATLAKEQEHIKKGVSDIRESVKTLTDKPAKRWDMLVDKTILLLLGTLIGLLFR